MDPESSDQKTQISPERIARIIHLLIHDDDRTVKDKVNDNDDSDRGHSHKDEE